MGNNFQLINDNSLTFVSNIQDATIDLIVTDPAYEYLRSTKQEALLPV